MSELIEMQKRHMMEIDELREKCKHPRRFVFIRIDSTCVGAGAAYPSDNVICRNCGEKKIILRGSDERKIKVKKTLDRQGFKDERLKCAIQYGYELV